MVTNCFIILAMYALLLLSFLVIRYDSPRYLISQGRTHEALESIGLLYKGANDKQSQSRFLDYLEQQIEP
jgi:hypothetical protein